MLPNCRCQVSVHHVAIVAPDHCRMAVLNDFEANGYGVTALDEKHVVVLNDVLATEKVDLRPPALESSWPISVQQTCSFTPCNGHAWRAVLRWALRG